MLDSIYNIKKDTDKAGDGESAKHRGKSPLDMGKKTDGRIWLWENDVRAQLDDDGDVGIEALHSLLGVLDGLVTRENK